MASQRAPKQWQLTKNETLPSYESWRQNLLYTLTLDKDFGPFLTTGASWGKKTATNQYRGFDDDGEAIPQAQRKTKIQKTASLELMLGQIANFCPVIARNTIVKSSTSLDDIWQKIRQHYGFQASGAHFLDLATIRPEPDERPEDLYQRLSAFFEDNLLTANTNITHHGETVTADEDMTPTLENTIIVMWLKLIHTGLPQLVKQKYGSELRNKTLASLKPEISQALPSLLDELQSLEDSKAFRSTVFNQTHFPRNQPSQIKPRSKKLCTLCKTAGRSNANTHWLSECFYLSDRDKKAIAKSRAVPDVDEEDDECVTDLEPNPLFDIPLASRRVCIIPSPWLDVHYHHSPVRLTLDCGATTNMIRASAAQLFKFPVQAASQNAHQADGTTPLDVVGECHIEVTRGNRTFILSALVVNKLDVDILAGMPFMTLNDVAVRPARNQIIIHGEEVVHCGHHRQSSKTPSCRRTQAYLLRGPNHQTVVLPGEFLELETPKECEPDSLWALEPRYDTHSKHIMELQKEWPPLQEVKSVDHVVRLVNGTQDPVIIRKHEHICQIRPVTSVSDGKEAIKSMPSPQCHTHLPVTAHASRPFSSAVSVDPDGCLLQDMRQKFVMINKQYDNVFNPRLSKYNGASGNIQGTVNMGPVLPPQRKGRLPQYNKAKMEELQNKFDELEANGIFAKPEQVGVNVEYLNLSFLVQKPSGGTRLVTAFGEVGYYSKPQPSLMPNMEDTLRSIACWDYLIKSDLQQSFYQIPLSHSSMKFCGVATPYKGVRVYTRCAMGMPGSETALEELMSRVLGHLVQEGVVAKIADDLYCGGKTPEDALAAWTRVLEALSKNNLSLSASKTVICPKTTSILGWIWTSGTLRASPHRISALAASEPPKTVRALRSFIGAYKVLSRVLKGYAQLLHPLEAIVAGKQSRESIEWTEDLHKHFTEAKNALKNSRTITLPHPDDTLWIVTDGAVKDAGIGATLYILRDNELKLGGFFNAKLKKHQITWLPCEVEALGIGIAVSHFAPYIIQSRKQTHLLTDSRPCVLAYKKLLRGQFSTSARVTTFLSVVSRYQVQVGHISGVANLPSDFASRHPVQCPEKNCQVCQFISDIETSVVRSTTVEQVTSGHAPMPFTSRAAWRDIQQECPDLRRVHSHLKQGTRPTKKMTKIADVKRYLQCVVISYDGLLVVPDNSPFTSPVDRIVVPKAILHGLLTALHIRFCHPSAYQLKRLTSRYFFALNLDNAISNVTEACDHCGAIKSIPKELIAQSTSDPPNQVGVSFALDVMRRYRQYILVLRETVTSFTCTKLISSEKHEELRDAIIMLCAEVRCQRRSVIRVDPAPGLVCLQQDTLLQNHGIALQVGRIKNKNKNPVAERAVEELGLEILRISPEGGPVSAMVLALATANMNSRIRRDGLSSRELWTQRDQITGQQLPFADREIIMSQHESRKANHNHSAKSKAPNIKPSHVHEFSIGDLVYIKGDGGKERARDKYMVTGYCNGHYQVRKFTKCQFRAKTYDIKASECYPVSSNVLSGCIPSHIKGLDDDCDSESEPEPLCPVTASGLSSPKPQEILEDISDNSLPIENQDLQPNSLEYIATNNTSPEAHLPGDATLDCVPPAEIVQPLSSQSSNLPGLAVNELKTGADALPISQTIPRRSCRDRHPPDRFGDCVADY